MTAKGRRRWRSCARKVRFRDEWGAAKLANMRGMRAYECGFCGGWHLTKGRRS